MNSNTVNVNPMVEQMKNNIREMKSLIKRTKDPIEQAKLRHELAIQNAVLDRLKAGELNAQFQQSGIR